MEREKRINLNNPNNPNNPKTALARAFILNEINFWQSILAERRENQIRPGRVDRQILGFIERRQKALESEEVLWEYILHRYCVCLRRLNKEDLSFSTKEELRQAVDFFEQLLF